MFMEMAKVVMVGMAVTEKVVRTSSNEWKEKEAERWSKLSAQEKHDESIGNFLRNLR